MKPVVTILAGGLIGITVGSYIVGHAQPKVEVRQVPQKITVAQESYYLQFPKNFDATKTYKLAFYVHGAGGSVDTTLKSPLTKTLLNRLSSDNYIVAVSNTHGNNWGNDTSVNDVVSLYQSLTASYKVSGTAVIAESMGGLDGLEAIKRGVKANAFIGIYPVTNVEAMKQGPYRSDILASGTKVNPVGESGFPEIPYLFFASKGDTVVKKASNTVPMVSKLSNVTVVDTQGDHGDVSNFQYDRMIQFLDASIK